MANEYTKKQIIEEFDNTRQYQKACVNYNGKTEGKYYIEIIAEHILEKNIAIDPYPGYEVRDSFLFNERSTNIEEGTEKHLCRSWYSNGFGNDLLDDLGHPIECELNIVNGTKVNVDLVSFDEKKNIIYLIEVKGTKKENVYSSDETVLRCALEIETYYQSLSVNNRLDALKRDMKLKDERINANTQVKKAILVPENSKAAEQINNPNYPFVNKLIKKFDIKPVKFVSKR